MKMKTSKKEFCYNCLEVLEKIFSKVAVDLLGTIDVFSHIHVCMIIIAFLELISTFCCVVTQAPVNRNYYRCHYYAVIIVDVKVTV